ncbi:putative peptidoglycan glycosyltransferase FtsW [Actinomyces israelii]|nr:FtsW/RodA/SpoVE family cell cycle protein [Actinomyces israelii]WKR22106.1 putative peptidoglycan glycosyltransferase FtsW [Actinomyces israelii]
MMARSHGRSTRGRAHRTGVARLGRARRPVTPPSAETTPRQRSEPARKPARRPAEPSAGSPEASTTPRTSEAPAPRGPRQWWHRVMGGDGPRPGEPATLTYYALLLSTLFLLLFGLVMVFSVQSVTVAAQGQDAFTEFAKYLIFAVVGLAGMTAVAHAPVRLLKRIAVPALILAILGQVLVYAPGVGSCVGGNCNWVRVPGIGTIQPSEFIKLALCLYLGAMVTTRQDIFLPGVDTWRKLGRLAGWIFAPVALAVVLVLGGGDLGTVVVLALLVAGALWMGGLGRRWFVGLGGLGLGAFALLSALSSNRRARILAWWRPDDGDMYDVGYQPKHGRWALGTGNLWGVGPGSSRQKWGYLTQADSDYIFAVLGEEFGLIGTLIVIALFAVIGWCCARIIRRSRSLYVSVVTGGLMAWIVGQALINMSVVVGLLPVLGVPLPLISKGGSALVSVLMGIGVLLALARNEPGAPEALRASGAAVRRTLAVIAPRRRNRA